MQRFETEQARKKNLFCYNVIFTYVTSVGLWDIFTSRTAYTTPKQIVCYIFSIRRLAYWQ